jgi:hypothetical protein
MRAAVIVALCAACRINLDGSASQSDAPTSGVCTMGASQACMDAVNNQSLTWIQANIFDKQCTFSGCHNGAATPAGKVDLRAGMSYAHLVGFSSVLDSSRKLVVAGDPKSSYMEVMLGIIKPADATPPASPPRADVGFMPEDNGGALLCCQKLGAIDRWISAGAMNN